MLLGVSRHQLQHYPESRFGGYTDIDGTVVFFTRLRSLLTPDSVVLNLGCGRGAHEDDACKTRRELQQLRGDVKTVLGIDVDPAAETNPQVDEFRLIEGSALPVEDASVDLILCDMVLEHVEEPAVLLRECRRVLRPGGYFCARTPNSWSYPSWATMLIPNRYHSRVTSKVQEGRKEEDVFPTFHRCNTAGKLRRLLTGLGFDAVVYPYEAEPAYLSFSGFAYWLGVLHQRWAPRAFKPTLFAFAQLRPDGDDGVR
ncbi:MAG: class I SAM-dependent methyltransferase [Acidobacteriota bacterium]